MPLGQCALSGAVHSSQLKVLSELTKISMLNSVHTFYSSYIIHTLISVCTSLLLSHTHVCIARKTVVCDHLLENQKQGQEGAMAPPPPLQEQVFVLLPLPPTTQPLSAALLCGTWPFAPAPPAAPRGCDHTSEVALSRAGASGQAAGVASLLQNAAPRHSTPSAGVFRRNRGCGEVSLTKHPSVSREESDAGTCPSTWGYTVT